MVLVVMADVEMNILVAGGIWSCSDEIGVDGGSWSFSYVHGGF